MERTWARKQRHGDCLGSWVAFEDTKGLGVGLVNGILESLPQRSLLIEKIGQETNLAAQGSFACRRNNADGDQGYLRDTPVADKCLWPLVHVALNEACINGIGLGIVQGLRFAHAVHW